MGASMKDVARLADVSTATVSHVINNTRNVKPETRRKVLKAIEGLRYNVNPVARNLRSGSSGMIGYVVSNLANYFFMDIALVIDEILSSHGYHLIYINSRESSEKERDNIESLIMQNVDGLIVAPVGEDCTYMNSIIGNKCPCVLFDRQPSGFARDVVLSSNAEGSYAGTSCLIRNGYRKIGFVGSRFDITMQERMEGYRRALLDNNLVASEELIKWGEGIPHSMNEQRYGDSFENTRVLVEKDGVDAVFAGNALAMVGVFSYFHEQGCSIPGDYGLVSFDDTFWLTMSNPGITAVKQDKLRIGREVSEILLRRIEGDDRESVTLRIPTNLIERNSTKCGSS